ncbi:MCE family protein [Pseudonocardia sp.]|jgi:virulence factor Mce-like protein|uniref:MlaD family protein n=1 Tax=Pseudonocardia sp. TaxID=60912 RepID=UPI002F3F4AEB
MTRRSLLTILTMLVLTVVGLAYLLFAVVQLNPFDKPLRITINMARSGGLLGTSQVTYRGAPIGRITELALRPGGVRVGVSVDEGTRIPVDTEVSVANLSAAGEQFLDFRPRTDAGPFLADGAVINQRDTRTPVPFSEVISHVSALVGQVDPGQVAVLVNELRRAFGGSAADLDRIIDGGDFLLAGLEGVLPQTLDGLHNARTVLGTTAALQPELARFSGSARDLTALLAKADPPARQLLDNAPGTLALVDDVIKKDGPSVGSLLGRLLPPVRVLADRQPALGRLFPELSTLGPAAATITDGTTLRTEVDAYPRPSCDYGTPRRSPTIGGSPPPRLYRYCTQADPLLAQRGSTNVPRPPGDHTAGPPPGADPQARASRGPGG